MTQKSSTRLEIICSATDRGYSWEIIGPDLTKNDPQKQKDYGGPITPDNTGAEMHCSILTIAESPVEKDVIHESTSWDLRSQPCASHSF